MLPTKKFTALDHGLRKHRDNCPTKLSPLHPHQEFDRTTVFLVPFEMERFQSKHSILLTKSRTTEKTTTAENGV